MEIQKEKRKLAAVLFADIQGYTALFERSEAAAFEMVEQHRKDLQEIAATHKGRIVKYYGDGSLTLFSSVIEAARASLDLQLLSGKHHIPLRIGIHMGEMIEKDKDVYGDAVNVASRIQALGTAGCVLVSKTVEEEIKNHPGIFTRTLGFTRLKNVRRPVEVFALTNPGLTVPHALPGRNRRIIRIMVFILVPVLLASAGLLYLKNKWKSNTVQFSNQCVIIPPFVSITPNAGLDFFSNMASYELIKVLSESAKANTIPYSTMLLNTNADLASLMDNPTLSRRLGADIEIKGVYSLEGRHQDTIRITLSIQDLKENKLFQTPIPDILCSVADTRACLDELKNVLVGYWKSTSANLLSITSDSAFINFLIAQNKWADPNKQKTIKSYLLRAIHFDPHFVDAWFLLLDYFHNEREYASGLDTLQLVEDRFPDLDERQQLYLGYYKADFQGNNVQAFKSFYKVYQLSPHDLFVNNTTMVMASEYLNDPLLAIRLFKEMEPDSMDLNACAYCVTRFSVALKAYLDLNDLTNAGILAERIRPFANKESHFISLLKYYTKRRDTLSINTIIRTASEKMKYEDEAAYLSLVTARMAAVEGDTKLKTQYLSKATQLYTSTGYINLARCYLLAGNLKAAQALYENELKKPRVEQVTYAYLGVIYAREGDTLAANQMIDQLGEHIPPFDFGFTPYAQGRIKGNLKEYTAANHYLSIALEKGIRFLANTTFLNDPDMIVMNLNKEYLSLLASHRLNNIE